MFEKHLHYDIEIETAIVGACMLEDTAYGRVRNILNSEMFYSENNKIIFKTLEELFELSFPNDILSVVSYLARKKDLKLLPNGEPLAYGVTVCTNAVVGTSSLEYHSMLVRQMYIERELLAMTKNASYMGKDGVEGIVKMKEKLDKLSSIKASDDWLDMTAIMIKLDKHLIDKKFETSFGVPTGFSILDKIYGGFADTDLIVLAARPSVGKTAMLIKLAKSAAQYFKDEAIRNIDVFGYKKQCVGIISLEMSDIKLACRVASMETGIEYWKIYRSRMEEETERVQMYEEMKSMSELPIYVSDTADVDMLDIRGKAMKLKAQHNLKILFIDYLQLIDTNEVKGQNREREVAKLSRGLKLLAMQIKIPIILLAQLNRGSETEKDKKPKLYHLRESGAIEQDADAVLLLHRDYMSGIKERDILENNMVIGQQSTENEADIIVAKWRDGMLGEYKIGFDGEKMEFYELGVERNIKNKLQFLPPVKNHYETDNEEKGWG